MQCININAPEYKAFKELTGLSECEINALIRDYYEKYDKVPTVDRCLTLNEDTSKKLMETYNIKKSGKLYITRQSIDLVEVNKIHRDLEVSVKTYPDGLSVVDIKQRALPHRELPNNFQMTIFPTIDKDVEEIIPVYNEAGKRIYEYKGEYYVTDKRISSYSALRKTNKYATLKDAINAKTSFQEYGINSVIINNLLFRVNLLQNDLLVTLLTRQNLPENIYLYKGFVYPKFIINPNGENGKIHKNGVIELTSMENLEYLLLKAQGYDELTIQTILNNLGEPLHLYSVYEGDGKYTIKLKKLSFEITSTNPTVEKLGGQTIEPFLDRLEELYGIKFNRITTQDIIDQNILVRVNDAALVKAFILNGEIYINVDEAKTDSPIHELSHLLLGCLRQTNPELYLKIVNTVEKYPEYEYEASKYLNRARLDVNEEIFVDLFAKHYILNLDLNIDEDVLNDVEYEIARSIDSAIFPYKSTTTSNFLSLMGKTLEEIMDIFGTAINRDTVAKAFKSDLGRSTRYIANMKELLFKTNQLKEYCNG